MFKSIETGFATTIGTSRMKTSQSEFINTDANSLNGSKDTMTTSRSTLGTTTVTSNGLTKHDTILEDKEKN